MEASELLSKDMDIGKTIVFSFLLHSLALSAGVVSVTHMPLLKERLFMVKIEKEEERPAVSEQGEHTEQKAREERKKPDPVRRSDDRVNVRPDSKRDSFPVRDARQSEGATAKPSGILPDQEKDPASEREEGLTSLTVGGGQTGNVNLQGTEGIGVSLYDLTAQPPVSRRSGGGDEHNIRRIQELIEKTKIYPQLARKRRQEGTAVVQFSIDARGLPLEITVSRSSGFTLLDSAARDIITKAAPFPRVKGAVEVPITFRLRDED